jgi:hypothetical protein
MGIGWGISLHPSQKTEAYLAQWSWQNKLGKHGWGTMSGITDMSIEEVAANPIKAQTTAKMYQSLWKPVVTKFVTKTKIRVSARRNFTQSLDERTFKLGQTKKWAVGFFDTTGASAFSKIMEMKLDSSSSIESLSDTVFPWQKGQETPKTKPKETPKTPQITMAKPTDDSVIRPVFINQFASSDPAALVSHYSFSAISGKGDICGPKTTCAGYALAGDYTVWSFPDGTHKLRVEARVKSPKRSFKKKTVYGLGWGLNNNGKTETFAAVHSYDQDAEMFTWSNSNLKSDYSF